MKLDYREGDRFAIPLRDAGYGTGLIARMQPRYEGVLLGYFVDPRSAEVPRIAELCDVTRVEAATVRLFGHLHVRQGRWPILGRHAG